MKKHFVDQDGNFIGTFAGFERTDDEGNTTLIMPEPPKNAVEVPEPPQDARQKWNGTSYNELSSNIKALQELSKTEEQQSAHRALEEIVLYITEGKPLSDHLIQWVQKRKTERAKL